MAAVRVCKCGCSCFLRPAASRYFVLRRFLSSTSEGLAEKRSNDIAHGKRKKRDEFTVLKALSSTVQKVPGSSNIGFLEDAYFTPRSDFTKREYIAAIESGRNAAEFVIKKYPDLCNLRQPVPAWPDEFAVFEEKEDEETLKYLIKSERVEEAIKLYELLEQKGDVLTINTLNRLLDLVGYYGVGIEDKFSKTSKAAEGTSSSSSDSDGSSSDEEEPAESESRAKTDNTYGFKVKSLLLSNDSYCSRLFSKIENKTAETYEAYILALLKYDEFSLAQRFHDEMREKGFKGSTYLYKAFLDNINKQTAFATAKDKWGLAEEFLNKMTEDKFAVPDVGIYNSLLNLASKLEGEAPLKISMLIREMIANGLEPSPGSYLYALEANDARKSDKFAVFKDVVHRIYDRKGRIEVEDSRDVSFFSIAMTLAKVFGQAELAKMLMEIVYRDGNWALLGRSNSAFLGNYIATLCRSESNIDIVFEEYDRLVPNELVPRDWVYGELFQRLERGERPERIFKLSNDMKVNRVRLTYPICERIFLALSSPLPKELLKEGLDTALETMKWMAMFDIPVTGLILSQVARLYSLNGMLNEAFDTIKLFEEKDIKPTFTMLKTILDGASEVKDQRIASKVMKKMMTYNYRISDEEMNELLTKLELSDSERFTFNELGKTN
ncbi:small ribosomal subunit protein mS39-like [Rhopilema esculentum]|uniref:small ribosomal subunit protein mS39-like n=1 Tax=Rhopilema esculentum TaxID=499914 RepID=UPI0031DE375E